MSIFFDGGYAVKLKDSIALMYEKIALPVANTTTDDKTPSLITITMCV